MVEQLGNTDGNDDAALQESAAEALHRALHPIESHLVDLGVIEPYEPGRFAPPPAQETPVAATETAPVQQVDSRIGDVLRRALERAHANFPHDTDEAIESL